METLKNWTAKRAGGRITITHATGKVVGVDSIKNEGGDVIATDKAGKKYKLSGPFPNPSTP